MLSVILSRSTVVSFINLRATVKFQMVHVCVLRILLSLIRIMDQKIKSTRSWVALHNGHKLLLVKDHQRLNRLAKLIQETLGFLAKDWRFLSLSVRPCRRISRAQSAC